jgi:hypothetical protein
MSIKDIAESYVKAEDAAFQKGDFDALSTVEDAGVVYHMGPPFGEMVGHEAHKQYILGARQAGADLKQQWEYLAGDGNLFAMAYKAGGRFVADMPGMPPMVGKTFANDYLFVLRVENNRVVEVWAKGTMAIS